MWLSGRTLRPVPFSQITLDPSQSTFLLTDILLVTGVIFGGMSTPPVLIPEKQKRTPRLRGLDF